MNTFFMAILLMVAPASHAEDRTTAYDTICKPMTFESEREKCLTKIRSYSYYNKRALGICNTINFDSNKILCLDIIGDKTFEGYEMDKCVKENLESKKFECLRKRGTHIDPSRSCVPKEEVIDQLSYAISDLHNGDLGGTDQRLSDLLIKFKTCNR